jgi:hypothetical protein
LILYPKGTHQALGREARSTGFEPVPLHSGFCGKRDQNPSANLVSSDIIIAERDDVWCRSVPPCVLVRRRNGPAGNLGRPAVRERRVALWVAANTRMTRRGAGPIRRLSARPASCSTMANFAGLTAARRWWGEKYDVNIDVDGLAGLGHAPVFASAPTRTSPFPTRIGSASGYSYW